ncbi:TetR/AcrR family transcriptional regulator [Methylomonas sp. AM2-LC]|uniref:TetR/AcrR family transcriptional regulator n=1 Tax=Methylomonas sp. AM2-LC TaxID=3153301 RepID=UPI003265057E
MIRCGRPCKGDEQLSRDRLLDSAKQLFLEYGYGNLSMEVMAKEARVSLRTIYNQFDGKAGIFGALIKRCSDQFIDSLPCDGSPEEALTSFARVFLFRMTRPDAFRIRAILIGESARFPDLAFQYYEHGPRRTLAYLTEFFRNQQLAGFITQIPPEFLSDQFLSTLRGERFHRLQLGLEPAPDESETDVWAKEATTLFLRGCLVTTHQSES